MRALRTRHGDPTLQILDGGTHRHDDGAGDAFVADEILIGAETLGAEAAIRVWLGEHGIHVTTSHSEALSTDERDPG